MDTSPIPAWTITADHDPDRVDAEFRWIIPSFVGLVLPDECMLTSAEIATHPEAKPFRIFDEIGVHLEGYILGDVGDLPDVIPGEVQPWRQITGGHPHKIELLNNGEWQTSEYLGEDLLKGKEDENI